MKNYNSEAIYRTILSEVSQVFGFTDTDRLNNLEIREYTDKDHDTHIVFVPEGKAIDYMMFDNFVEGMCSSVDRVNKQRQIVFSGCLFKIYDKSRQESSKAFKNVSPVTIASVIKELTRVRTESQLVSNYLAWLSIYSGAFKLDAFYDHSERGSLDELKL